MTSIEGGVTTILFPGSRPDGLTPANVEAVVKARGLKLWDDYRRRRRAVAGGEGPRS